MVQACAGEEKKAWEDLRREFTNKEIKNLFALTHSSTSKDVKRIQPILSKNLKLRERLNKIKKIFEHRKVLSGILA